MRKLLTLLLLSPVAFVSAQLPEDALRYAYPLMGGTARNQAIGGAGASLGGDITSAYINPAGIGMYKNKEIVLTPGFKFSNNKYDYLGANDKTSNNAFSYGTSGVVLGSVNRENPGKSFAFAIAVNQVANYNNHVEYTGVNDNSSWSEQYAEQLVRDQASVDAAQYNYIFGSSLAYWTFLVDSFTTAQGLSGYLTQTDDILAKGGSLNQHNIIDTKGGAHEISLAFGNSMFDKVHLGASLNVPIYSFKKDQTYREDDLTGDDLNYFKYFEYKEHYETNGVGFNAKLGIIVRPMERLRLGLAFHTPTFGSFTDKIQSSITANTENYTNDPQPLSKTSNDLADGANPGVYDYELMTPFRLIASGSWVINEVSDVKKQKGFITADLEFVNYGGTRYSVSGESGTQDDVDYYNQLNDVIKNTYKSNINVRVGGEMKFNTMMGRLGFAYMGSPYKDKELNGRRILLSGGVGYRNKGFFVDLTYVEALIKDSQVPYHLEQKANPIADGKNNRGNVVLTFGVKI